ncbi:transposase [Synechococcus sp. PCC 7336]|uniref:transposase n=1 Tax=Synechococcus sp. PCC 7336 TaxID=195250 RepID=UPI000372DD5F|nr:transposase [Synechococcus sp. PCC 7336]
MLARISIYNSYRIAIVEEMMPNATVVADRFHVMKIVNEELDKERRKEKKAAGKIESKAEREEKLEAINKTKYISASNGFYGTSV